MLSTFFNFFNSRKFIIYNIILKISTFLNGISQYVNICDSGWLLKSSIRGKKLIFVINTKNFFDTIGQNLVPHHTHHNKSVTKEINMIVTEFWSQQNIWKCVLLWLPKVKYKRPQKKNQKDFTLLWRLFDCLKRLNLWRCFYKHAYYALRFKHALTWRAYV